MSKKRRGIFDLPEICLKHDLDTVIISPGSRNAPIILSLTKNKKINCYCISDERSAAYFALGFSQYTKKPVGLVCTSGTAVLNYAPAVAESYYQNIPLVLFTADRPPEWIDQSDNQSIRQSNIYNNFIKGSFELPVETENNDDLWFNNRVLSQAIDYSCQIPPGPVHINIPLREPLYKSDNNYNSSPKTINTIQSLSVLSDKDMSDFQKKWKKYSKKMILCGIAEMDIENNSVLLKLSEDPSVIIIAENLSNISGENIIHSPEKLLAGLSDEKKALFQPELLLSTGQSVVSKELKKYLRDFSPEEHWYISEAGQYIDTFKCLRSIVKSKPAYFLKGLVGVNSNINSQYSERIHKLRRNINKLHQNFLRKTEYSDLKVFDIILKSIPEDTILHLGNSTPVRYSQLFETRADIIYYSNRGTSGIDGCISTAAGSAGASKKNTVVIIGDISFLYDSNSLWNNSIGENFRIIVINNNGGNIFNLIKGRNLDNKLKKYFQAPHDVKINAIAEAYGISHNSCGNIEELKYCINDFFRSKGPVILEIKTDSELNTKVYSDYFETLKQQ